MSAQVKWKNKQGTDIKNDVAKTIDNIKKMFKAQISKSKELKIEIASCGHGYCPFGSGASKDSYIDFQVGINNSTERIKDLGEYDVKLYFSYLKDALNALKATKGYETLSYKTDTIYTYVGSNDCDFDAVTNIYMLGDMPKEFISLNKLLSKYANKTIKPTDWYCVDLFGKRGTYDESGRKRYTCYSADICQQIIDDIRKYRTSKDKLTFSLNTYDDIDTDYSMRYETECYGYRKIQLHITIKTPTGRIKYDTMH